MSVLSSQKSSYKWGLFAERLGVLFLSLKGYRILARRAKTPVGEIDIIMKRGHILVAVEVKARKTTEMAAYSITATQKRRISKALEYWRQHRLLQKDMDIRYDALLISPWRLPKHIKSAWDA